MSLPTRRAVTRVKNEFWTVFRVQLRAAFTMGGSKKRKKSASTAGYLGLWLLLAVIFGVYEFMIAASLAVFGALHILPILIVASSSLLTFVQSITYTKTLIFCPKDHDLLFSLPVKGTTVVSAKLATLYVLDLVSTLAFLLPCLAAYTVFGGFDLWFFVSFLIMSFFVPLIPILFAAIISAVVSLIASRFRRAKTVGTVLYLLFFGAFMFGTMTLSMSTAEDEMQMMEMMDGAAEKMLSIYPPARLFSDGVQGSISSALLFMGLSLLAFVIVSFVFGKCYAKFHEFFAPRSHRAAYKLEKRSSGAVAALVKKDVKRYLSSPGLLINQGAGLLMIIVFAVIFPMQFGGEEMGAEILVCMMPYLFAMGAAMTCFTNASISLEGKMFPMLKSLPVSVRTILSSKLALHNLICLPFIGLSALISGIVCGFSVPDILVTVAIPLLYSYNTGVVGLLINLKKYKFDWATEMHVAKNSLPVAITMFGGMILSFIPMIGAVAFRALEYPLWLFGAIIAMLALAVSVILTAILRKKGEKWFLAIEF